MGAGLRVGLVARGERQRGIGVQCREFAAHMDVTRTLVVDVGRDHEQFDIHPEDFERVTVVRMNPRDGTLPERAVRRWLYGLDVVFFVETPYDWRLCDWARDAGARTVCQANPEFYRHGVMRLPWPDGWWNPTTWRMDAMPPGTIHVPVPVALERFSNIGRRTSTTDVGPVRFLHPVGKWAMYDRNGTELFIRAAYLAGGQLDATVTCLHELPHEVAPGGDWVKVEVRDVADYWRAYDGFDVLVMPRRYGGLSLPVQEAMAAGLAVVMPDVSPNRDWPIIPVPATSRGGIGLPAGRVAMAAIDPGALASTMIELAGDPERVAEAAGQGRAWAEAHSWEKMADVYRSRLADVIADPQPAPPQRVSSGDPFRA